MNSPLVQLRQELTVCPQMKVWVLVSDPGLARTDRSTPFVRLWLRSLGSGDAQTTAHLPGFPEDQERRLFQNGVESRGRPQWRFD